MMDRKAFLMGSNGTASWGGLKYARADAERMAEVLGSARCGFDVYIPNPCTDPFDLHRQIAEHARTSKEIFLCYFSGHGVLEKGELFLVLDDTDDDLYTTALPVRHVLDALRFCNAHNKLLILDCCHAGGAVGSKGGGLAIDELKITPENHLILMASGRLEKARELDELQGSFLASAICAALGESFQDADRDRDERISIEDLKAWLEDSAARHNRKSTTKVPCPHFFGQQKGALFLTLGSDWTPHEIQWADNSTMVILPIQPIEGGSLAFGIGKHPITNAQYRTYLEGSGRHDAEPVGDLLQPNEEDFANKFYPWREAAFCEPGQPVVCVDFEDAVLYCEWVNQLAQTEELGITITCMPSYILWDYAAYGTEFPTLAPKSWLTQTSQIHHKASAPATVDITGARTNKRGVADMFGNVWEWCGSVAEPSLAERNTLRHFRSHALLKRLYLGRRAQKPSVRGGSFVDDLARVEPRLRATELSAHERTRHAHLGFRIAALVPTKMLPNETQQQLRLCPQLRWEEATVHVSVRALLEGSDF